MSATRRDMTRAQFERGMAAHGWVKPEFSFLGYWARNGLHVSEWNYATRREALAAFIKAGERHDARNAAAAEGAEA